MNLLARLTGWPHEGLHVLALWLIGRRPLRVTRTATVLPPDLSARQRAFVTAFPALIFLLLAALGVLGAATAQSVGQFVLAAVVALAGLIGVASASGDLMMLTAMREEGRAHDDRRTGR